MALDQTSTFSERLADGESPADIMPNFNGIELILDGHDAVLQEETLRGLNAILAYLKDKNPSQSISRFFPLQVGLKNYENAQELARDIQLLGKRVESLTLSEGPKPVGEVVGGVMTAVVEAMKARGNWTPGHQAIWNEYLSGRETSQTPLN